MSTFAIIINSDESEKVCKKDLDNFLKNNKTIKIKYSYRPDLITNGYRAKITIDKLLSLLKTKNQFSLNMSHQKVIIRGNVELIEALFNTEKFSDYDMWEYTYRAYLGYSLEAMDKNMWTYLIIRVKNNITVTELIDIILPIEIDDDVEEYSKNNSTDDKYLEQFIQLLKIMDRPKVIEIYQYILLRFGAHNNLKMLKYFLEYLKDESGDYTSRILTYIFQNKLEFAETLLKYTERTTILDVSDLVLTKICKEEPSIESLTLFHDLIANNTIELTNDCLAWIMLLFKRDYSIAFIYISEAFPNIIYHIALNNTQFKCKSFVEIYNENLKYIESL